MVVCCHSEYLTQGANHRWRQVEQNKHFLDLLELTSDAEIVANYRYI